MDKVTIVTVTYNAEEILEETILSVINQSYENIEYIIIDGASTDKTVDIIGKYAEKISYWISEPDSGLYFAMNKAIEKATGKWINFMNAGDTFADNDVVAYVMDHKERNAELIYGNYRKKNLGITVQAQEKENWYQTMPFCHQTLFTKAELMKTEFFDTNFKIAADHNFILKMYQQQKKFYYLDKTLAVFLEGGVAHSNTVEMCIESLKVSLDNGAAIEDIYSSSWYKYLCTDQLQKKQNEIKQLTTEINRLRQDNHLIMQKISKISTIQTWKHPLKKIKAYKELLSLYHHSKQ